jgi:hypothetical protein
MQPQVRASSAYKRLVRRNVQIALDGKTEASADRFELGNAHAAEFGVSHAEIAKAEGDVGLVGIEF